MIDAADILDYTGTPIPIRRWHRVKNGRWVHIHDSAVTPTGDDQDLPDRPRVVTTAACPADSPLTITSPCL